MQEQRSAQGRLAVFPPGEFFRLARGGGSGAPDAANSKRGEVDFVVEDKATGRVSLVEVKSGKTYKRHVALANLLAVDDYQIAEAIVLCNENVEHVGNRVYLPIYAAGWLK